MNGGDNKHAFSPLGAFPPEQGRLVTTGSIVGVPDSRLMSKQADGCNYGLWECVQRTPGM